MASKMPAKKVMPRAVKAKSSPEGTRAPKGTAQPLLKGNIGTKTGTGSKTAKKVPAKKVPSKATMGSGKKTAGGIKYGNSQ
jgi:hypothetical protein